VAPGGYDDELLAERSFGQRDTAAPGVARRLVADLEPVGAELRRDLSIVVSELVANAVRHTRLVPEGTIRVVIRATPDRARVEVHDPGQGFDPTPRDPGRGGLGLGIVAAMAVEWGIEDVGHTVVWCTLRSRDAGLAPSDDAPVGTESS
jgi:anti-sigma regulatory factor (Ser/Thr protein kinase)